MNYSDLENLAQKRKLARLEEFEAKTLAARTEANVSWLETKVISAAYEDGTINGKNADTRKRQEADVLASSTTYQQQVIDLRQREDIAQVDQAEREYLDDLIGLTKAWLYSQREDTP